MIHDYINYEIQGASARMKDLSQREKDVQKADSLGKRKDAEDKAVTARENLLAALPPTIAYEYLAVTQAPSATSFRNTWQKKNRDVNDCLEEHVKTWREGSSYYETIFRSPKINLAILPPYSFFIQFTFTLAQPYISRDEQDFYIIDNSVRKDKIFGLPYVASTSWKGSLRAAFRHSRDKEEDRPSIRHLFGNEKDNEDPNDFQAGCLYFYPTFFTSKSLEIINPQNRKLRVGEKPILFECVPKDTTGVFTLLYIPFDLVGRDEQKTREQVAQELQLVCEGLQAVFRICGFGAKTNSGFGLAKESLQNVLLEMRAAGLRKPSVPLVDFDKLLSLAAELKQTLVGAPKEVEHE